ncbi:MAG: T9SS type A sorting domain-containing protein, partial [Ignavibacteria bacterium]|nr:T9SS type A sorting domain-containing protein [Ignavibacteria bacterium]
VNLFTINFPNSSTGYIGGTNGKLIKTTNGGTTWDSIASGSTTTMQSMDFVDGNTGYIGTTLGIVKKTTNAGSSWTDYNVGASITSNGISFSDVNTGFMCSSSGVVRKTTNAGVNWAALTTGTTQTLNSIYFVDANTGYSAGATGTIIKTTNGGTNWTTQTTGITDLINSIKFNDASRGMAACNAGKILVTTNGGSSWSSQTSNVLDIINLRGTFIENGNNLYIIGQNGVILNSTDQPLPVELASFTSTVVNRNVKLSWQTVTETNNSGFEIERTVKTENEQWNKIGFVTGNGTTNNQQSYTYEDKNLSTGTYKYRLKQIDYNGNYTYYDLSSEAIIGKPVSFELSQNYPNPFNPSTKIVFSIPFDSKVTLKIFDITGKEIKTLLNDFKSADFYTVDFNASELPSGIYFAKISAQSDSKDFAKTIKMILSK